MTEETREQRSWKESFAIYLKKQCVTMFFLGFSAGLPFLLVFGTLIFRLKNVGIDTALIGYFSWIGITYSIKVAWAPIVDRIKIPLLTRWLGHRRSWMLVAQIGIALGLVGMALTDPLQHPFELAVFGLLVAFSSATQDISIDAYRIEAADPDYQAAMSAMYVLGYRIAILVSFAGALHIVNMAIGYQIAKPDAWAIAYAIMASLVSVGVATVLLIKEPFKTKEASALMPKEVVFDNFNKTSLPARILSALFSGTFIYCFLYIFLFFSIVFPVLVINTTASFLGYGFLDIKSFLDNKGFILLWLAGITAVAIAIILVTRNTPVVSRLINWVIGAIIGPLVDFFYRFGFIFALMIIFLVLTYRISDIYMGSMATALYGHLNFSLPAIANITKVFGLIMTIAGAALGGVLVMRYGIMRPLLIGAVIVAITNIFFSVLAMSGKSIYFFGLIEFPAKSKVMLTIVIAMDNLSGGFAQAAFIAYLSSLVNKSYTATQYALFSSLMTLPGKILSGFSGEVVAAKGYPAFFVDASLFGLPAISLIVVLILLRHIPEKLKPGQVAEESMFKAGIRGWLIAPTLCLALTPIMLAYMFSSRIVPIYSTGLFKTMQVGAGNNPTGVFLTLFATILFIVTLIWTIMLLRTLFAESRKFKRNVIFYYLFIVLTGTVTMIFTKGMSGEIATKFGNLYDPFTQFVMVGIFTFAWLPYILFSKRVRATFVK